MPRKNPFWWRDVYKENPEKIKASVLRWQKNNKEKVNLAHQSWRMRTPRGRWNLLKNHALKRGVKFLITSDQFVKWYVAQEKVCVYCGVSEENLKLTGDSYNSRNFKLCVDRKENHKPYRISNSVLACNRCNFTKSDFFTYDEMIEIGKLFIKPKRHVLSKIGE